MMLPPRPRRVTAPHVPAENPDDRKYPRARVRTGLRALGTTTHRPIPTMPDTEDGRLLGAALAASRDPATKLRLTQAQFGTRVLGVSPRSMRRYIAGRKLDEVAREKCRRLIAKAGKRGGAVDVAAE